MGLFQRAVSVRAGAQAPTPKGLLRKSQEILARNGRVGTKILYPLITQEELKNVESNSVRVPLSEPILAVNSEMEPPAVPLTWNEAGLKPPPERNPIIHPEELKQALMEKQKPSENEKRIKRIFSSIAKLPESIEAPAALFSILKENLSLTKAAFLLYDPIRMVFAPWASIGYDKTTLHRLRIPLGYKSSFNRVVNGEIVHLSSEQELDDFKKCFSSREYATLTQLIFTPFVFDKKTIGVLLITHLGKRGIEDLSDLLKEIAIQTALIIYRAREEKLKNLKMEALEQPEALEDRIQELARSCKDKGTSLLLIKLSLERLMQQIIGENPFLDLFRLREDIVGIINSLVYEIGTIFNLDRDHILLLIHQMEVTDPELLLHQLGLSLSSFFKELAADHRVDFKELVRIYPEENEDILELLADLA